MPRFGPALGAIVHMLFPYRTHLEAEVLYLRSQLARADRRIEELEQRLNPVAKPHRVAPKLPELKQPIDWKSFKDMNRQETNEQLQAGSSPRGQDTASIAGN